jgi:hypothetical protein
MDNVKGSQDLLGEVEKDISSEDYESLENRINEMEADGHEVSVTSVKKEYDAEGVDRLTERVVLMVESGQL